MRPTGFDFLPEAAVPPSAPGTATSGSSRASTTQQGLTWQRIASGLFQPLGLKIVKDTVYVCCRDQIVILARPQRRRRNGFLRVFQQRPSGDGAFPRVRHGPADRRGRKFLLR